MTNPILEAIKSRRSVRKYKPEQISKPELSAILEAGSYAPSAHNMQSWHFTVVQNSELLNFISEQSKKGMQKSNMDWAVNLGLNENYHLFFHAPTVIFVSGNKNSISPLVDCSAAIQNLLLAAESLNIGSCWIGLVRFFFADADNISKLNLPTDYLPYYAVTLGYKSEPNSVVERTVHSVNYII